MDRRRFLGASAATALLAATAGRAGAQEYPTKLIRFLVGFPPGGSADLTMRLFADRIGSALNAKTVIENLPGASSNVAAAQAVRAEPDGHTLFLGANVTQSINPHMLKLTFDPLTALAPISQLTTNASLIAVGAQFGVKTMAEFLVKAKAERDGVFYGTSNVGFQLPGVQFARIAGIKLVNVPFKGGAETVTAVLSGNVPMIIGTPPSILPHVQSGAVIALCVTTPARSAAMPDIPGAEEVGLKGLNSSSWFGLYAPAKTPAPIITKLHATVQRFMGDETLRSKLATEGMVLAGSESPTAFAAFQKRDHDETGALVREAGLAAK